jgi:peptidylprolyl isomerase domain and WD repeat-containing protein 1
MSDSEQDASVLGKRPRNGDEPQNNDSEDARPPPPIEDDDDDEVGPMPMQVDGAVKKKRKGASRLTLRCCRASRYTGHCF